jgi:small subunit ribosomal protein S21
MAEIILSENDKLEWAIKAFRRRVQKAGILKDVRAKRYYMKPSLARRLKAEKARRRLRQRRSNRA